MLSAPDTYKQDVTERVADLNLDAHGQLTGSIRYIMTGQEALHWRQDALENDSDEVKKEVGEWIQSQMPDGVHATFSHSLALNNSGSDLMAIINVKGSIGSAAGNVLHYERNYEVRKVRIPASDAKQFEKIESAILTDERGTAVLRQK